MLQGQEHGRDNAQAHRVSVHTRGRPLNLRPDPLLQGDHRDARGGAGKDQRAGALHRRGLPQRHRRHGLPHENPRNHFPAGPPSGQEQTAHRTQSGRQIHPNSSFIEQLERYEKSLAPVKSVAKPTGKAGWEEKSTTTSWYSPPAPPTVQPSRQAGLIRNSSVPTLNSGSYDNRLR